MGKGMVKCQHCGLDHWSLRCPYRHQLAQLKEMGGSGDVSPTGNQHNSSGMAPVGDGAPKVAKYVPPSMRAGAAKTGASDDRGWDRDQEYTLRVTNLPEESTDEDLRDLFRHFGRIKRVYLARDKVTLAAKGFAFVTYLSEVDAERAIAGVHKHRYGNLILYVEWSDN
ncbi:unnamed protein product [Medioppia subpectinata]|uniref:RRM domain-containing protein n=1 Tax=Medioppia subpectinata TaxID=1979941 RepID=A0A7R9LPP4_9ACAR|nr:unnamed protein product [Medioppia subpectinata]CAG2120635.1 unnamed protein product [Medioppia subpectinata]